MVDDDGGHRRGLREPQIDGDTAAALLIGLQPAPIGDAPAGGTEMESEVPAPDVDLGRTRDLYPLVLEIVGPEHPVASAHCAIARGGRFGHPLKGPAHRAAMAKAFDHLG